MQNDSEPLRVDISEDPELKVDSEGTFKVPTYDIDPEDQHIADAILAMDPIRDVPSPFTGFDRVKEPELTLASLPPEMRDEVEAQLAKTPASKRADTERLLVRRKLEQNSEQVRSRAGVGQGALPFHQTLAELEANHRFRARDFDRISEQLADVVRYDVRFDPNTGERIPVPVYAVEGQARAKLIHEQERLDYEMKLLEGVEGQRQIAKALQASVKLVKQREAQLADESEVQTRAEKLVRERRLDRRAEARARSLDPNMT